DETIRAQVSVLDADGRFEVRDLSPGSVRVVASASGFAPSGAMAARATSPEEPPAPPIEIRLSRGGSLQGRVIDRQTGDPLTLARVSYDAPIGGGAAGVPLSTSVVTGEDGGFTLSGLAPGTRSVMVVAYRHHMRILSGLAIEDGQTLGPVTVDLQPTRE